MWGKRPGLGEMECGERGLNLGKWNVGNSKIQSVPMATHPFRHNSMAVPDGGAGP